MPKKMYVVQSENGGFWCGMNSWDVQLRKAQIFHSLKYAGDVVKRFKQYNPQIVEVSLTIVPETKTHADRIRAMTDEELYKFCLSLTDDGWPFACQNKPECDPVPPKPEFCNECFMKWLQQPAEGD